MYVRCISKDILKIVAYVKTSSLTLNSLPLTFSAGNPFQNISSEALSSILKNPFYFCILDKKCFLIMYHILHQDVFLQFL